ncbi:arginine--tRNA ligase [Candidatus Uhrbacteria bacterium RIFCSPLOWO2_02_FULL_49_11]|uniref:Arginine--tRNA ligase n=1 Tax=Candidatus Uhrbacteria bacterium RIFCSPLOWO2_02_FULL_49_11 TaxID=1802409 RepID=A0A1F7VB61_9BACT|nr:MAG: arginine--tRNA ligase [Candidatus Uhrbacteria bacterium RIFCSPLOWO2_02_FULL_49_11]
MQPSPQNTIEESLRAIIPSLDAGIDPDSLAGLVAVPDSMMGDYATNLPLRLSKALKRPSADIAQEIAEKIKPSLHPMIEKIEIASSGYVNFFFSKTWLQSRLPLILDAGDDWGRTPVSPQKVLVEYSSPNIAKMMHVGHFRSTLIGHALDNILRHIGHDVVNDNHLGDWGTQFGKLLVAYKLWHTPRTDAPVSVPELEALYIRFHKELPFNPTLEEQARAETVKLQQGDPEAKKLWQEFCRISLAEFNRVYELFCIAFDYQHGESFYEPLLARVVQEALDKKVAVMSDGAVIIPLGQEGLPDYMIRKTDGGYLYSTSDLATIKWREDNLKPDLVLYVVGDQQILHFKQLFAAAHKMGYAQSTKLIHVPFGLILGEHGRKMSTREGEAVDAIHFINKSIELAKKIINEKNASLSPLEKEETAKRIAISALVYNDLSRDRESSVTFNWDAMMNFKGASAPYLLYTYVRINGIVRKIKTEHPEDLDAPSDHTLLREPDELLLLRTLVRFPDTLTQVTRDCRPHILVHYLEELANVFHASYDRLPVAQAETPIRRARLSLFQAVSHTMQIGMKLLGMQPVERM